MLCSTARYTEDVVWAVGNTVYLADATLLATNAAGALAGCGVVVEVPDAEDATPRLVFRMTATSAALIASIRRVLEITVL